MPTAILSYNDNEQRRVIKRLAQNLTRILAYDAYMPLQQALVLLDIALNEDTTQKERGGASGHDPLRHLKYH